MMGEDETLLLSVLHKRGRLDVNMLRGDYTEARLATQMIVDKYRDLKIHFERLFIKECLRQM